MRHISFLWRKGERASKSSFWQFMITLPVVCFLWIVVIRMAWMSDKYFLEALIGASAFFAVIEIVVLFWYHQRRKEPGEWWRHKNGLSGENDETEEEEE